jgi:DnaJ-domain-containing protein 1
MAKCVRCGQSARFLSNLCNQCIDKTSEEQAAPGPGARSATSQSESALHTQPIANCPRCDRKLRLPLDLPTKLRCPSCRTVLEMQGEYGGPVFLVAFVEDVVSEACRVLGIGVDATAQQQRAAYRERISQYHPDKLAALGPELKALAEEKTKEINRAYSLLVNRPVEATRRTSTTVRFSQVRSADGVGRTQHLPRENMTAILVILFVGLVIVGGLAGLLSGESRQSSTPTVALPKLELVKPTVQVLHVEPLCDDSLVVRPKSGVEFGGRHRGGLGRLKVENGTENDAVAVLVDEATRVATRAVYVRSHEIGLVTSIPPGAYRVRFQLGISWLRERRFCAPFATSEFNDRFDFREVPSDQATEYSTFEVTLHPVIGGTAKTHALSARELALPSSEEQDR